MADEATLRISLSIRKGNLTYQSQPTAFNADVTGTNGPAPGAFNVSTDGTNVDLSELTTPGLCRLMNLDDTNYVELRHVGAGHVQVLPARRNSARRKSTCIRLSRHLASEYAATGTSPYRTHNNTLRLKANTAACKCVVEAFEA
jgi:hypothetical protein